MLATQSLLIWKQPASEILPKLDQLTRSQSGALSLLAPAVSSIVGIGSARARLTRRLKEIANNAIGIAFFNHTRKNLIPDNSFHQETAQKLK